MIVRFVATATLIAAGLGALLLSGAPASAASPQEKLETCGFGADELNLTGVKRKAYLAKCTADQDSPRGKPVSAAPAARPKPQPKPQAQ
jgi:hypothetical protein